MRKGWLSWLRPWRLVWQLEEERRMSLMWMKRARIAEFDLAAAEERILAMRSFIERRLLNEESVARK